MSEMYTRDGTLSAEWVTEVFAEVDTQLEALRAIVSRLETEVGALRARRGTFLPADILARQHPKD